MPTATRPRTPTLADAIVLVDPELFSWYVCGVDLWWKQVEILEALNKYRRVAVKACNSSSKTKTSAIAGLWWVSAFADLLASCITTSSSWAQVEKVIWKEIHSLIFEAAKRGFTFPQPNQTDLAMPLGGFLHGMSTNEAVNFHGFHGRRVLFVKDESTGIEPAIHEAIDSVASGGHVVQLDLGNPVTSSGPFNDLFSNPLVKQITIDAFETPNYILYPDEAETLEQRWGRLSGGTAPELGRFLTVQDVCELGDEDSSEGGFLDHYDIEPMGGQPRSYLVSRRFAWEVYRKYGIDSPYWQAHVRGQFPDEGSDTLIPWTWIQEAIKAEWAPTIPLVAGLDVAGPGNAENVLTVMGGPVVLGQWAWSGLSSQRTQAEIVSTLSPYRAQLETLAVDSAVIGHHLCGALAAHGLPVVPVNVGLPALPGQTQKFANLKAQFYWTLRLLFEQTHEWTLGLVGEPGIVLGNCLDDTARVQLSSLRFEENERGQMIMERKIAQRKRGIPSPDRAESLMLACAKLLQGRLSQPVLFRGGAVPPTTESPSRWLAARRAARWDRVAAKAAELYAGRG